MADYTPENPSERWRELVSLYQIMHAEGDGVRPPEKMFAGMPRGEQISRLRALIEHHDAKTLLDYGSGKGMQWRLDFNLDAIAETTEKRLKTYLGLTEIRCYDPGYEPFAKPPVGRFDGVICLDVLEHCPEEDIPWIMEHIFGFAKRFVFANIASFPAAKFLANGENAHCTVKPVNWWRALIDEISARHAGVKYLIICEEPVPGNREIREIRLEG